ncbi:hypothetical protein [Mesoterricola sediminis]|uniref:hypothetical protein n=1 Tax=Mesoterricola sediminis TaxID=2927980 RepID=UPI00293049D4|nr:hypothetical protein [Mesoterricola sediminis]
MSRPAWLGAGFALALAITLVVVGGGTRKAADPAPAPDQAPAPTLAPVVKDVPPPPSASAEAPNQATTTHKESNP